MSMEADIKKELLFAVPVYQKTMPRFHDRKQSTIEHIQELRKEDEGVVRSNAGGWHSSDKLHLSKQEDIAWIMQRCLQISQGCIEEDNGGPLDGELHMVSAWANVNGPGHWNAPHTHLPCQWSGCFYVNVNEEASVKNDGNIVFIDPLPLGPQFRKATNAVMQPKDGMVILFPSYLMHMVEPHVNDEERISIAFNMQIIPKQNKS